MSIILQRVKEAANLLGNKVEEGETADSTGKKMEYLAVYHGKHRVIVLNGKTHVLFDYVMDISPEDSQLLAKQPQETLDTLMQILVREMLVGRSGFYINFSQEEDSKLLRRIGVQQKIMVEDEEPRTIQRIADAIQELVVIAMRCQTILGKALQEKPPQISSSPHEQMYI